jgi:hypothetical protein
MESKDHTTEQLMFSLIEVWKGSTQTQQEFCKQKDLDYQKFQYWFRKYRAVHSEDKTDSKFFRQLKLKTPVQFNGPGVELIFPDGRKVIFHQPVDASFLRTLLG